MRLLIIGAGVCVAAAACVAVNDTCGAGLVDCGGYCANLSGDETDCGACGAACTIGDYCSQGSCVGGSCFDDGTPCYNDSDCCSDYCASDGNCGCIPPGEVGCASDIDCCGGLCHLNGVCE